MSESDDSTPTETRGDTTTGKGTPYPVETGIPRSAAVTYVLFLAGPLIWSVHFFAVYLVSEMGCTGEGPGLELFDPPVPGLLTVTATAVAAVTCVAAAAWSYRRGRRGPGEESTTLLYAGAMLSALAFVTVLFVGVPAVVFPACG